MSSSPPPPGLYCKIKANINSIKLKTGNNVKKSRLVHHTGIEKNLKSSGVWAGKVDNGGREEKYPPNRAPAPAPAVCKKNIFHLCRVTQLVKNYPNILTRRLWTRDLACCRRESITGTRTWLATIWLWWILTKDKTMSHWQSYWS